MDGAQVVLVVENLSADGAALICPEEANDLRAGKRLAACSLVLPGGDRAEVDAVIRWRIWPKLGIQFVGADDDLRGRISRFILRSS
jgi:hypothetical protein